MLELKYYKEHPSDFNRVIFYFFNQNQVAYFKSLIEENNITYSQGEEPYQSRRYKTDTIYYFIIRKTDFTLADKLSLLTYAKFREPFIPDKTLKYFILFLFVLLLSIALVGYFRSMQ